jgi:hypothetical protein
MFQHNAFTIKSPKQKNHENHKEAVKRESFSVIKEYGPKQT